MYFVYMRMYAVLCVFRHSVCYPSSSCGSSIHWPFKMCGEKAKNERKKSKEEYEEEVEKL